MLNQFTVSLWGDEAFSAVLSQKSIPQIISIIARDTSPPLYNLTEHIWFRLFSSSEIAIRGLSFFYYLIAAFFVYEIGRYLWNKKTGLIAALLTLINPFFFIYAFEGRMYSLLAATVCASMYFFLKKSWKAYAIATTLALYTHHFAIFAIFAQGLWILKELFGKKRKTAVGAIKYFLIIGILYLPWLIPLYNQTRMVGSGFWLGRPTLGDLANLISKYLTQGIKHPFAKPALYLTFTLLVLRRWGKDVEKSIFVLSWFLIPIFAAFIISQKFSSIFFDRYLLYTIPAACLLLASNLRRVSLPLLVLVVIGFLTIDSFYFTHPTKRPFGELATYVKETQRGDDCLINWNSAAHHLWESKYYGIPAPIYVAKGTSLPYYVGTALMTESDIIDSLPSGKEAKKINRIGVITSGPVEEVVLPGYTKSEEKVFGQLKFIWFLRLR
jgi:mannosyltransferase